MAPSVSEGAGHHGHQHTIVVGYDGSEGSRTALQWAVGEARIRGADLCIVGAWPYPDWGTFDEEYNVVQERLEQDLERVMAGIRDVRWQAIAVKGNPAEVLMDHSGDADLLVVGSRGHGGFVGLMLGSVGHQLAAHARVPLAIVR